MRTPILRRLIPPTLIFGLAGFVSAQQAELAAEHTALAPGNASFGPLPHSNTTVVLSLDQPAGIVKEPAYRGTPLYGRVRLGNGVNAATFVVVDHPKNGAYGASRLYVDVNRNGDLTDDGDGSWGEATAQGGDRLGPKIVQLRASYSSGGSDTEVRDQPYSVMFIYDRPDPESGMQLSFRRTTAFTGKIEIKGRKHRTLLVENDNDAVFRTNKGDAGKPIWILIDLDGDGRFSAEERFDSRYAFTINGQNYLARNAAWGERYALIPFTGEISQGRAATAAARPPVTQIPLLATGTPAPDFVAIKPDGSELRLSDFRGQVVILDFWAPWCGPCIRAMPYVEKLHQQTRAQGVSALGVCVWDTKENFDKWQVEPKVKTTFPKAFDPAGVNRDNQNADSIAKKFYNVTGIPTLYVIDREGNVVQGILGFSGEPDTRLAEALARVGVKS